MSVCKILFSVRRFRPTAVNCRYLYSLKRTECQFPSIDVHIVKENRNLRAVYTYILKRHSMYPQFFVNYFKLFF